MRRNPDVPQLAIAPSFLDEFSRLDRSIQSAALSVVRGYLSGERTQLEGLTDARDHRVRVLQIGPEWSGVVVPTADDAYCLVTVRRHDDAINYARNYVPTATPEAELDLTELVPQPGVSVPAHAPRVSGPPELTFALKGSFAAWRVTLHPDHQHLAEAEMSGPALVTGAPGTGTTVLALHRAAHLAARATGDRASVLLATASRGLAQSLRARVDRLVTDPAVRARIDITTLAALAVETVTRQRGAAPDVLSHEVLCARWHERARADGLPFTGRFLVDEWEQVLLAHDLPDLPSYIRCDRNGRLVHLDPALRPHVWRAIHRYAAAQRTDHRWTHPQLAAEATAVAARSAPRYGHAVVVGVQDLHPAQLRLLRALVTGGPDDLFLTGDWRLRDHDPRVSLLSLGIDVRGRGHRLHTRYRTTAEILQWARPILTRGTDPSHSSAAASLTEPRSVLHGPRPTGHAAANRIEEYTALAARVRAWLAAGVPAAEIAVAGRDRWVVRRLTKELHATEVATTPLDSPDDLPAVRVGTLHALRGHEFRCVAIVGLRDPLIPPRAAIDAAEGDAAALEQIRLRERQLLWSACTAARDDLYVSYTGRGSRLLPELAA